MMPEAPEDDRPASACAETVEDAFRCYISRIAAEHAAVLVEGELDLATAPILVGEMHALVSQVTRITVDLSRVSFLDSSGLAALLATRRQAAARGVTCCFVSLPAQVARIVTLTGTAEVLGITQGIE
jgi:anti-sigma B factor antagonist